MDPALPSSDPPSLRCLCAPCPGEELAVSVLPSLSVWASAVQPGGPEP